MRYLSLFSGVEAASVAWEPLGWEPVAFCEVDAFPSAVLAQRFPGVPNLGDITKVDWKEFYGQYGAVDVLVGGSPCQSFSIAGKREGLAPGAPSRLMLEYIRAIRDLLRASGGIAPRYIVWENVPGALSSERGAAFGQLLAELDELGYGLAWRVLDAQFVRVPDRSADGFFGPVAQRRRRVFLVGSLGTPGAAEILFERESLRGNHPTGRKAREAIAADDQGRAGVDGCAGSKYHQPAVMTLTTANTSANGSNVSEEGVSYTLDGANSNAVAFAQNTRDEVRYVNGDGQIVGALAAQPGMKQTSYVMTQYGEVTGTLQARADSSACADRGQNIVCMADDNAKAAIDEGICGSLKVGGAAPLIATAR